MSIAHVALWTRDLNAAAAFWRDYFQAEIGTPYHSRRREGFISCFVTLSGAGPKIELMTIPGMTDTPTVEHPGWDHIAISVGDRARVDQLASRCRADGLLLSDPRMTGDGFYEAVITMPDGTLIEITP